MHVQKTFACVASVPIQAKQNSKKEFSYSGRAENGARTKKVKDPHPFCSRPSHGPIFLSVHTGMLATQAKEISIPSPRTFTGNSEGVGSLKSQIFKGKYEANLEIQAKQPSLMEVSFLGLHNKRSPEFHFLS